VQFSSYVDFRNQIGTLLDGDDISQSDLSVQVLDLIIGAGEVRIYRDIRSSCQDTQLAITSVGNSAPLPGDYLELKGAPFTAKFRTATYEPWQVIQNALQTSSTTASNVMHYSFEGDAMIFYPAQGDGTLINGRYYKRFTDISSGLNALFTRHPDLFIYAALSESAPFLGEMTRLPIWQGKYGELAQSANEQERRRVTRGSKLATRVA
jgi:hypothetical protein